LEGYKRTGDGGAGAINSSFENGCGFTFGDWAVIFGDSAGFSGAGIIETFEVTFSFFDFLVRKSCS